MLRQSAHAPAANKRATIATHRLLKPRTGMKSWCPPHSRTNKTKTYCIHEATKSLSQGPSLHASKPFSEQKLQNKKMTETRGVHNESRIQGAHVTPNLVYAPNQWTGKTHET